MSHNLFRTGSIAGGSGSLGPESATLVQVGNDLRVDANAAMLANDYLVYDFRLGGSSVFPANIHFKTDPTTYNCNYSSHAVSQADNGSINFYPNAGADGNGSITHDLPGTANMLYNIGTSFSNKKWGFFNRVRVVTAATFTSGKETFLTLSGTTGHDRQVRIDRDHGPPGIQLRAEAVPTSGRTKVTRPLDTFSNTFTDLTAEFNADDITAVLSLEAYQDGSALSGTALDYGNGSETSVGPGGTLSLQLILANVEQFAWDCCIAAAMNLSDDQRNDWEANNFQYLRKNEIDVSGTGTYTCVVTPINSNVPGTPFTTNSIVVS